MQQQLCGAWTSRIKQRIFFIMKGKTTCILWLLCLLVMPVHAEEVGPPPSLNVTVRVDPDPVLQKEDLRPQVLSVLESVKYRGEEFFAWHDLQSLPEGGASFRIFKPEQYPELQAVLVDHLPKAVFSIQDDVVSVIHHTVHRNYLVDFAIQSIMETLRMRLRHTGIKVKEIKRKNSLNIELSLEKPADTTRAINLASRQGMLSFHVEDLSYSPQEAEMRGAPAGSKLVYGQTLGDGIGRLKPFLLRDPPVLNGFHIEKAEYKADHHGLPGVAVQLSKEATQRFYAVTLANVGRRLAMVLDDKVIFVPNLHEAIENGSFVITGALTEQAAKDLAVILNYGPLSVPVRALASYPLSEAEEKEALGLPVN